MRSPPVQSHNFGGGSYRAEADFILFPAENVTASTRVERISTVGPYGNVRVLHRVSARVKFSLPSGLPHGTGYQDVYE